MFFDSLSRSIFSMDCPTTAYFDMAELNSKGIHVLKQRQNADAIQFFFEGLRIGRSLFNPQLLIPTFIPGAKSCGRSPPTFHESFAEQQSPRNRIMFSVALPEQDQLVADHNDFFSIHNRALHFSTGHNYKNIPESGVPRSFCLHMSGIFLYNIGLAHHLEGLQRGNSQLLAKALDFYSMAHLTFIPLEVQAQLLNLGELAIVNNIGHIHACFRNIEATRLCGGELCRRLLIFKCVTPTTGLDENDEYNIFFLNMAFISRSKYLCAPSA
jgi:hypothetical protein